MNGRIALALIAEPPFCFCGDGGRPMGYDVEVALRVLEAIGNPDVDIRWVAFADLIPGIADGRWDISTPVFVTPERAQKVAFGRPAWALADGLMIRAANVGRITGYRAMAAAPDFRLVVVADQVQELSALRAGMAPRQIVRVASPDEAVSAVRAGRADAYASVALAHRGFLLRMPDPDLTVVDLGESAADQCEPALGAYAFSHDDPGLRHRFDVGLGAFSGSPAHRSIMDRYGFTQAVVPL